MAVGRSDRVLTGHSAADSLLTGCDRPVGLQCEQDPFHVRGEPARIGGRPHGGADVEAVPQILELVGPAQVHQHFGLDPPVDAPGMGRGDMAHHAAVGVRPP